MNREVAVISDAQADIVFGTKPFHYETPAESRQLAAELAAELADFFTQITQAARFDDPQVLEEWEVRHSYGLPRLAVKEFKMDDCVLPAWPVYDYSVPTGVEA